MRRTKYYIIRTHIYIPNVIEGEMSEVITYSEQEMKAIVKERQKNIPDYYYYFGTKFPLAPSNCSICVFTMEHKQGDDYNRDRCESSISYKFN